MADTITDPASEPTPTTAPTVVVRRISPYRRSPQASEEEPEPKFTKSTPIVAFVWTKSTADSGGRPPLPTIDPENLDTKLAPSAATAGYVVGGIAGLLAIVLAGYFILRGRKHGWKRMFPCCVIGGDPRRKQRKKKEKEQMQSDLEATLTNNSTRPPSTLGKYKQQTLPGGNKNDFEMSEKVRNGGASMDLSDPFASTSTRGYGDGATYDGGALPAFVPGRGNSGRSGGNGWEDLPDFPGMDEPTDRKGKGVAKGGYEALPTFGPGQDGPSSPPRGGHGSALPAFIPGQSQSGYDGYDTAHSPDKGASSTPMGMQLGVLPEFVPPTHGSQKRNSPPPPPKKGGGSELARPPQRKRRPTKEGPRDPYDIDDILDDDNYDEEDLEEFEDSVLGKPGPSGTKRADSLRRQDSYARKPSVAQDAYARKASVSTSKALPTPPPVSRSPPAHPTVAIHSPASPGHREEDFQGTMSSILPPPKAPFLSADTRRDSEASSLITSRASYNENPFNPPEIPPPFVPPKDDHLQRNASKKQHIRNNPSVSTFQSMESTSAVSYSTGIGRPRSNSGESAISSVKISPIPPTLPELPHLPDLNSSQYFSSSRQPSMKRKDSKVEKRTIGTRTPPPPPINTPPAVPQRVIYSDEKDYQAIPIAMPGMPETTDCPARTMSHIRKITGNRSRSSSSGSSTGPSGPLLPVPEAAPLPPPPSGVYEMPDSMPYTPQYYFSPSQKYSAAPPPPPQPYPHMYPVPPTIPTTHGQARRKQSPSMITDRQSVFSTAQDNASSQQIQLPTFHQHSRTVSSSTFQTEPPLPEREFLHTPPIPQAKSRPSSYTASSAKEDELARYAAKKRERMAKLRNIEEGVSPATSSPHRAQTFAAPPPTDPFQEQHTVQRSNTSGTAPWGPERQRGGSVAKEWNEGW
ncbi:hypothetical protein BJ508DRAFT_321022 [Ascobolus immersus RN42]|uniref:Uncharacterized protein n=1 Tax=Ascobolus immersus RN42 TaxID=1160509 RepID=A0A3N4ISE4_ASCIM|nr:hypothetical protein BJ508DRAFT_321022 [Ascobolus immersus RN42]